MNNKFEFGLEKKNKPNQCKARQIEKKTHYKLTENKQKSTNKTEKVLRMFSTEWFVKLIGRYIIIQSFEVTICEILFTRFFKPLFGWNSMLDALLLLALYASLWKHKKMKVFHIK